MARFEHEFSAFVGAKHAAAVSSGTTALHLGLLAAGIGPGDEVILPSFTFAATANSVVLAGATAVFADVEAATFCLDTRSVEASITEKTAAIIAVHLFGKLAPMRQLRAISKKHSLLLLEDAAQAHGAALGARRAGTLGDIAAFSFYATKNMTTGEGGMITSNDPSIDRRVRLLRNQGMLERYQNEIVGFNARMTDIAAAIGRVQLRRLPESTAIRQSNAALYNANLRDVTLPITQVDEVHVYHQYTIRTRSRDSMRTTLSKAGIQAEVFYPTPVHRLPSFNRKRLLLPVSEKLSQTVLSLPVAPHIGPADVLRICGVIEQWLG